MSSGVLPSASADAVGFFGTDLEALLEYDREVSPELYVPQAFKAILDVILTKGLVLGVSGLFKTAGSSLEMQEFVHELGSGEAVDFFKMKDVHVGPGLIKSFLRQLPDCVLMSGRYDEWAEVSEVDDPEAQLLRVRAMVGSLPDANQALLCELMHLFNELDMNQESTKMDSETLARIMVPYLLWKPSREAENASAFVDMLALMIEDYQSIFELSLLELTLASLPPALLERLVFRRKLLGHPKTVGAMVSVDSERVLWSADSGGQVRVWDTEYLVAAGTFETGMGRVVSMVEQPSAGRVWIACEKGLQVRSVKDDRKVVAKVDGQVCLSVCVISEAAVWTASDSHISVWRCDPSGTLSLAKQMPVPGLVKALSLVGGKYVWAGGDQKGLTVYDLSGNLVAQMPAVHRRRVNRILQVGNFVYSVGDDALVCQWSAQTMELVARRRLHSAFIFDVCSLGKEFATTSWDRKIIVWDESLKAMATMPVPHTDAVYCMRLCFNRVRGCWLLWLGSGDGSVSLFRVCKADMPLPPDAKLTEIEGLGTLTTSVAIRASRSNLAQTVSKETSPIGRSMAGSAGSSNRSVAVNQSRLLTAQKEKEYGDATVARWEIDPSMLKNPGKTLGTGSFGTVYVASLHGKEVAVKRLSTQKFDEKVLEEFRKEVSIMAGLRHPNILLFMGACALPGNLLIVTEMMPRGSVYDLLRSQESALTFKRRMLFAKEAAQGVNHLHNCKPQFLHLDLKSANLLVDDHWHVKVADFGLSVVRPKTSEAHQKIRHGPIGTPLWMAPEVLMNREYNEKADVYSFALVMWEMVTGSDPWEEVEDLMMLVRYVCTEGRRPVLPSHIPTRLRALVTACWDPDPEKRPPFDQIIQEFDHIIIDGLISRETLAREIWREKCLGQVQVDFKEFVRAFLPMVGEPYNPNAAMNIRLECLRASILAPESGEYVTIENYARYAEWFGPFGPTDRPIERMMDVYKQPYLHGNITTEEAAKRVTAEKKRGTYLVRFSTSELGGYSLTVHSKSKNEIVHYRISHRVGKGFAISTQIAAATLDDLLQRHGEALGLRYKSPCPGGKYQALMANQNSMGYMAT